MDGHRHQPNPPPSLRLTHPVPYSTHRKTAVKKCAQLLKLALWGSEAAYRCPSLPGSSGLDAATIGRWLNQGLAPLTAAFVHTHD